MFKSINHTTDKNNISIHTDYNQSQPMATTPRVPSTEDPSKPLKALTERTIQEIPEKYITIFKAIKRYATEREQVAITLKHIGIDPAIYDDHSYLFGIAQLVEALLPNSQFIAEDKSRLNLFDMKFSNLHIKYINALILQEQEKNILNIINIKNIKNADVLLGKLKRINEENQSTQAYNPYVIKKLMVQAEIWKIMQSKPKLAQFPFENIWKFCVDIEKQPFGPYVFEDEPGYIVAVLNTLLFALKLEKPSFLDYIQINLKSAEDTYKYYVEGPLSVGLRDCEPTSFGIMNFQNMDTEGIQDLRERSKIKGNFFALDETRGRIEVGAYSKEENIVKLCFLFKEHEKKIENAKNKEERLMAHLWLVKVVEVNHHFRDCNLRSSNILLLSLLANDPELPMVLLDTNPNLIDGNGPIALLQRVIQGMNYFNQTCGNNESSLTFNQVYQNAKLVDKTLWSAYHPREDDYNKFVLELEIENLVFGMKQLFRTFPILWENRNNPKLFLFLLFLVIVLCLSNLYK